MICNKMKKIFSVLLFTVLMVNILPTVRVFANGPSGKCGDNVTYSFDESTGKLTISGNGEMENYESSEDTPWHDYCDSMKSVVIKHGIQSIGNSAFAGCTNLIAILISRDVLFIGDKAFERCEQLTQVRIPGSISRVGTMAFWNCYNLTMVYFSGNIEPNFGDSVFEGCPKLNKIKVPDNYTNSSFCGKEVEKPYKSFNDNSSFCEEVTEELSSLYFADESLSNPSFPFCQFGDSEDVNENPFARATHATYKFNRSTGVLTIFGQGPMPECESRNVARWCDEPDLFLRMLDFLTGNKRDLDDHTAYLPPWAPLRGGSVEQNAIKSVVIEEGVTSISAKIFQGCINLTSVTIPDSVTSIGSDAFAECHNLSSVTIGNNVKIIGIGAFDKCSSLTSITIPNSVTTISAYAFAECGLTSITIPESVTTIDRQAFNRCYNLLSVGFLGAIEPSTGKNVFNKCSKLKKVIVSNEYTSSTFCGKSVQRISESESNCAIA